IFLDPLLSRPRPDAVARFLTPSRDRSRRRRFMPVMSSPCALINLQQQDTQPTLNVQPTSEPIIPPTDFNAEENNNDQAEDAQFEAYEFINPFSPPGTETAKPSSEQVLGNPSEPVQTRQKLATDPKLYMFTLTMSKAEPTNIKEAMADHIWIEEMQEKLH
ncbi:hypothetical protein Tco_1425961, partial [Tanacetum coccineum]